MQKNSRSGHPSLERLTGIGTQSFEFAGLDRDLAAKLSRKLAEETLREHAALLDLANEAIIVRDQEDRVTFWSLGAQEIYGWTAQEAVGHITHELLKTRFPKPRAELSAELAEKGRWRGELIHARKDGRVKGCKV